VVFWKIDALRLIYSERNFTINPLRNKATACSAMSIGEEKTPLDFSAGFFLLNTFVSLRAEWTGRARRTSNCRYSR
jgi:hypothetical protein